MRATYDFCKNIAYYLLHHPLVQLIKEMTVKYLCSENDKSKSKISSCLFIDYPKKALSESIVRQSVENALSLDEVNDLLSSVDDSIIKAISKWTPRSKAFKRIKMLYCKDTTSESSKLLYDQLSKKNNLSNLVTTSPAWEKCVVDD